MADWFKVRVKHVFYSGFTKKELATWIKLMALTTQIEEMPNERQMKEVCTKNELETLAKRLQNDNISIENILRKVIEDIEKIHKKRGYDREYRKDKRVAVVDDKLTSRGADKIRLDKSIYIDDFEKLWNRYPRKEGKKEAFESYQRIKKKDSLVDEKISLALENYIRMTKDRELKYIKQGATFFNNWEDYLKPIGKQPFKSSLIKGV